MEKIALQSLLLFAAIIGINLLMAYVGYQVYPTRRAMVKKFVIVVACISVFIGSIMVYMFYQFSKLGL